MTIANQKTPGSGVEIDFAASLSQPSATQTVCLIGHAASGTTGTYQAFTINNVSDPVAAGVEAGGYFGIGSELAQMVVAAVAANAGGGSFPPLVAIPLASTDAGFGSSDQAIATLETVSADFAVMSYDPIASPTLLTKLQAACLLMSGANRGSNQQFGTTGVACNYSVTNPASLPTPDTRNLSLVWFRNTGSNAYSVAQTASACAAVMAANGIPFLPLNSQIIGGVPASSVVADKISVGGGLESETALTKGWSPLKTNPSGSVAFVRTVTTAISVLGDGQTPLTSYYDVQDLQVLYYWRRTLFSRFGQTDFQKAKASAQTANNLLGEVVRLAGDFETQNMFQDTKLLAKQFSVVRDPTSRFRFNVFTPVNVIPGLMQIAATVSATTQFDQITL
jgi:phage tail sheath gpL-like